MKAFCFALCLLCATLRSALVGLYAAGFIQFQPPSPAIPTDGTTALRVTLFPEQTRAVNELLVAIEAKKEDVERQESLLAERQERVRQETIALSLLREELLAVALDVETKIAAAKNANAAQEESAEAGAARREADERKNTQKLAEFYARMEPQNAARLLSQIEPDRAARILTFLSDRQAGAIMDATVALGPDGINLAVKWTEIIRESKRPRTAPR